MTEDSPRRPWYSVDLLNVLVFCLFVEAIAAIAAIAWYRHQVSLIPEPGRAIPAESPEPEPRPKSLPESVRCKLHLRSYADADSPSSSF